MKEVLLNSVINSIKKYYKYDDVKLEEIRYGLEAIYLSIVKFIVVVIVSFFIHTSKDLGLFFITYGLLRLTAFGVHAKKPLHCWISTLLFFIGMPILINLKVLSKIIIIPATIILIVLIYIYAPADTEKRPLINKKKRKRFKYISTAISTIYLIIMVFSKNLYIQNLLFFSMLTEVIFILPITYKLFGVKYNNYKYYKRKEEI